MNRPLRIDLSGGLFHITARGDRKDEIFRSDGDRLTWLAMLGEVCDRFNFKVLAYCQMGNHFHILLETVDGGLARGMRQINGMYSQYFNRVHGLVGHVFQGRYHAILCQGELYLRELVRYIELNPVRAHLVARPEDWLWSSHRAMLGLVDAPAWLHCDDVLARFGSQPSEARHAYRDFVLDGINEPSPLGAVSNQLILGDDEFCASIVGTRPEGNVLEIRRSQRRALERPLQDFFREYPDPKEAMARAYRSLAYTMPEIASFARVSVKTVSRAISTFEAK